VGEDFGGITCGLESDIDNGMHSIWKPGFLRTRNHSKCRLFKLL
jgi:hypothetical protein